MRKLYFSLAFLAAFLFGANGVKADIVNNYTMDFNTTISTSAHDFKVGSGWGHLVDKYFDYEEYEDVYAKYTYSATGGRDGSGALQLGAQESVGTYYDPGTVYDLLVTPVITGKARVWVKKASRSGGIKFYTVTYAGGNYKRGDEISVDASALSTTDWTQIELPEQDGKLVGIRGDNVYIDDFSADQVEIEMQKALTIQKVIYTGPASSKPSCDTDDKFPITFTVTVKNTGDVALAEGMEGYSLSVVNKSKNYAEIFTTPLTAALAVGEETTVDLAGVADYNTYPDRDRYDVRENLTETSSYGAWIEPVPFKPVMKLYDANGSVDNGTASYAWGMVGADASKTFTIKNAGAAPLHVTAVEVPAGFTTSVTEPFTVEGNAEQAFTITLPASTPGIYSGVVTIKGDNVADFTFNVSGTVRDASKFYADFENQNLPAGSYVEAGWQVSQRDYNSSSNAYLLENGSQNTDNKFVTPLLKVAEGEKMSVDVARTGYNTSGDGVYLNIYYSADRKNWTLARKITGDELSGTRAVSSTYWFGELTSFVIDNIPAGNYYIGFGAGYTSIDNIYGFEPVTVAHDLLVKESRLPKTATVNNVYTATATLKNLNTVDEAADSYTASLFFNGQEVATAPATAVASGAEATFSFGYTPHNAGVAEAYIQFKNGAENGFTITSDTVQVTVGEETASADITVGEGTGSDYYAPIQWYNSDVKASSDNLYGPDMLTKYGLKAGAKIASISFTGVPNADKDLSQLNLYAYVGAVDSTAFVAGADYENLTKVDLYTDASLSLTSGENITTTINLPEPIVWDGQSAIRVLTYVSAKGYCKVNYACDDTYKSAYSGRGAIGSGSYTQRNTPIAQFSVQTDPSVVSGTVTSGSQAVAGATVALASGDVLYTTTTNDEGAYTMNVIQTDKTYTLTVKAEGYHDYTEADIDVKANVEKNISLKKLVVTVSGKVLYRDAALAGATVSLAHGDAAYTITTAEDGTYTLDGVQPGQKYAVKVSADKFYTYESADSVEVTDDTTLADITLYRVPVKVYGVVSWGGKPVAGARVAVARENAQYETVTGLDGKYELAEVVPDEKYAVTVKADQYADYAEADSVLVTDDLEKNISLVALPIAVQIPESGSLAFSADRAVDFTLTPDVKAYIVTSVTENYTELQQVDKVPANTGVLLKAAPGDYSLTVVADDVDAAQGNLLVAVQDNEYVLEANDQNKVWTLTTDAQGNAGFASVVGTVVPVGSAYLEAESELAFIYQDVTTGVRNINAANAQLDLNAPMYNLAGQKVSKAFKGVVVQNGKTFIKK